MPTLSIHGDVHIPDNLIHALGLKPGAELAFERQGDAIVMRPVKTNKISRASRIEIGVLTWLFTSKNPKQSPIFLLF
ncbi:MAG: AbrB/MazE/SpoVT family DNA-binding domain-containing protein [Methylococcaceae bacterium]